MGALTIREFLEKKHIEVDSGVNARIDDEVYNMLIKEFRPDMEQRLKAVDAQAERQKGKEKVNDYTKTGVDNSSAPVFVSKAITIIVSA